MTEDRLPPELQARLNRLSDRVYHLSLIMAQEQVARMTPEEVAYYKGWFRLPLYE